MFKNYTISVTENEEPNTMKHSAYCKEWDITTEADSIPQALSELFAAIQILESEKKAEIQETSIPHFLKNIQFSIPVAA